jgi:hypothetical protein
MPRRHSQRNRDNSDIAYAAMPGRPQDRADRIFTSPAGLVNILAEASQATPDRRII